MRAAGFAALALFAATAAASPAASLSPRRWLCFFDSGSAELSPRCQADALDFVHSWRWASSGEHRLPSETPSPMAALPVEIDGHADAAEAASGKAAALSRARAEAVAAFLRLNSVPDEVIKGKPFGAGAQLAASAGAEPQNRRVDFVARWW